MKQVFVLLLIALTLVVAFAFLTGDSPSNPDPIVPNTTGNGTYAGTVAVILPGNEENISRQVRNAVSIAGLSVEAGTFPSVLYYTLAESASLGSDAFSDIIAVITVTDNVSKVWDETFPSYSGMRLAICSPGYAAESSSGNIITLSTPPFYEVSSLRSLFAEHDLIAVFGPDTSYTNQYVSALDSQINAKVIHAAYSDEETREAVLRTLLSNNPNLLVLTDIDAAPELVETARESGITGPILVSSWAADDPNIRADQRMEGVYTSLRVADTASHPFYEIYELRFDDEASVYAAEAYDAFVTLSRLIPQSGGNSAYLIGWYIGKAYEGAAGSYIFDSDGIGRVAMQISQFRSGDVIPVVSYNKPPEEIVIGVYGNAETLRGANVAAEFVNTINSLNLPGASSAGISGLYGAKVLVQQISEGEEIPNGVHAVIGDLENAAASLPSVQTSSTFSKEISSISLSPAQNLSAEEFLTGYDSRHNYDGKPYNILVLVPEGTEIPGNLSSVISSHNYVPEIYFYQLPISSGNISALLFDADKNKTIVFSVQETVRDVPVLAAGVKAAGITYDGWFVFGDAVLGDYGAAVNIMTLEYYTSGDLWSADLQNSREVAKDVASYYTNMYPGRSMTGISARSFMAVVLLSDAFSIAGSTDPEAVISALRNLNYPSESSIFFGDGIRFDASGNLLDADTKLVQIISGRARTVGNNHPYPIN